MAIQRSDSNNNNWNSCIMSGLIFLRRQWILLSAVVYFLVNGSFLLNSVLSSSTTESFGSSRNLRSESQYMEMSNPTMGTVIDLTKITTVDDSSTSINNNGGGASSSSSSSSSVDTPIDTMNKVTKNDNTNNNPLAIPMGKVKNLPSIPENSITDQETIDKSRTKRKFTYGGEGDKVHLGGFTQFDVQGLSPWVWKHMVQSYGIKSILDVGCGRGISTLWFARHGLDTLCVEGSHDAVSKTMLPNPTTQIIEHDYSRGPWWPEKTYDAVWSVEFLEHVSRQYDYNYISTFRKAALLFVTTSTWGGWHHVEVHDDKWWIRKYESYGFKYDNDLTEEVRTLALKETKRKISSPIDNTPYFSQHIFKSMKVFINPAVAALPQHAHLFPEHGCYGGKNKDNGKTIQKECGTGRGGDQETPLSKKFYPLNLTDAMDKQWEEEVRKHVTVN